MVHQCTCKSLTEYMACKAEVSMWASIPSEIWRTYSYCDTAERTKQAAHLYCWFR